MGTDRYAYASRLRRMDPVAKIMFCALVLGVTGLSLRATIRSLRAGKCAGCSSCGGHCSGSCHCGR